jgi:hypothetical protein
MAEPIKKKDIWDKVDIVAKSIIALFVTGGIGFYTFHVAEENRNAQIKYQEDNRDAQIRLQEENRRTQTLIQIMNARESATASLRTSMFTALLAHSLADNEDLETEVVMLEMIGLNFRDSIQIKPMLESLDRRIPRTGSPDLRALLRKAARSIIQDQLVQIQLAENGNFCKFSLEVGESMNPECFDIFEIKLIDIKDGHVMVRTNTKEGQFIDFEVLRNTIETDVDNLANASDMFNVTYFDMPMIDFTLVTLDEPLRYSVVLMKVDSGIATLAVSLLPSADYSPDNRYVLEEILREIINPDNTDDAFTDDDDLKDGSDMFTVTDDPTSN